MDFTIRIARPDDAPQAAVLQHEVWRDAYPHLTGGSLATSRIDRWQLDLETAHMRTVTLAAELRGDLVGLCRVCPYLPGNRREVWGLVTGPMVDPAVRRRGIGAQLLGAALVELSAVGLLEVATWVIAEDVRSCEFFRRAGFERDGLTFPRGSLGTEEHRMVRREPLPASLPLFD